MNSSTAGDFPSARSCAIAATTARASTVRRLHKLTALITELSARDLDAAAAALFLDCSLTSARNYLNDLLVASVISAWRAPLASDCPMRNGYRLNRDPCIVRNFLADVRETQCSVAILRRGRKKINANPNYGARHFHLIADDRYIRVRASHVAVRRDPLVAALFGEYPKRDGAAT